MYYLEEYKEKLKTVSQIAEMTEPGWVCFSDIGATIPPGIMNAIAARIRRGDLKGITWHSLLDLEPLDIFDINDRSLVTPVSWFSGKGFAGCVNRGAADLLPCTYRDMPEFALGLERIDALLVRTAPMDDEGIFHVGTAGSMLHDLITHNKAAHIFVEADRNVPYNRNSPGIHIDWVSGVCENDVPLPVIPKAPQDDISRRIGELIAEEVPDGATIQLGIGAIPEAVGYFLKDKHDLGIHTELFSDSMLELIECGAVTNRRKDVYPTKTVATVAFGSEHLYESLANNPDIMMLPVSVTNDPYVIARNRKFISVNAALEVDLFGQVCAESLGTRHISGSGGQADFVRGAVMSEGGKSFIAFPSTAAGGTVSRIRPVLTEGALVTTGKNNADRIVTEYGIARLRGRTLSQRVRALIDIAHPDFRDELTFYARKMGYL